MQLSNGNPSFLRAWRPLGLILVLAGCEAGDASTVSAAEDTDASVPGETDAVPASDDTDDTVPVDTDDTVSVDTDDNPFCEPGTTQSNAQLGTVVCIPSGTFTMGCVEGRDDVAGGCWSDESPSRTVELTRSYWLMEAEVTQAQYAAVVGSNPSSFLGSNLPVEEVSWDDAVAFADAVSLAQGLTPCGSGAPYGCDGWRLPTEAEWEYAARGGEEFPYAGSNSVDAVAWYLDNSSSGTKPVCTKARNGWGLCDMSGNVWEWTWDRWGDYAGAATTDPTGPVSGSDRATRGGAWDFVAHRARVARRTGAPPGNRYFVIGFRLVRSVP